MVVAYHRRGFGIRCAGRRVDLGGRSVQRYLRSGQSRLSASLLPEDQRQRRTENILLIQGLAVTLLSLLFVVMPSVQSFYQILSQLTVLLYLIMYLLMFSGAIYLRYNMKRPRARSASAAKATD